MKIVRNITLPIIAMCLIISSCKEELPPITFATASLSDTTFLDAVVQAKQTKLVFIEEHTGQECANCPDGAIEVAAIEAANPGRIVSANIYNYFADPTSDPTFVTPIGLELDALVGPVLGWPACTIDRVEFAGGSKVNGAPLNAWAGYVGQQLADESIVNIGIDPAYDIDTRELTSLINIHFTEALAEVPRLSIMILEDHITAYQKSSSGTIDDYDHRHVLREMLTPKDGIPLNEEIVAGRQFVRVFDSLVSEDWDDTNVEIVAFVTNEANEVLQVAEVKIQ